MFREALNSTLNRPAATVVDGADRGGAAFMQGVIETICGRMRPSGVFLVMLDRDGAVVQHDGSAAPFFTRFVLPRINEVASRGGQPTAASGASGICASDELAGVAVATFAYVEKRQTVATILLAARRDTFTLDEDVLRACSQLEIDAAWLGQAAGQLPGYSDELMQCQALSVQGMLRDQLRLGVFEREMESLSGQLANTYEELSLIYQISGGMKINRRAADFFSGACRDVMNVINLRGMGVALLEPADCQEPVLYGAIALPKGKVHRLSADLIRVLVKRSSPLIVNQLAGDKTFGWLAEYAQRLIAVPLQRQDQILGCMFGLDKGNGDFDSVDSKLLNSIANESAIYLENVMLFEDVHGLMMGLLHSLTSAVDAKDAYTCGHSERVALLSRHLAKQAGLSDQEVERIYMAGLLHDVGKIGVPEAVLQKSGKLTAEEFEQIKKHPEVGAKILQDIKQIKDIIPGVLHHHERFDGKGYPHGLAGDTIPLMGRIICLADCFDAMTSSRTYRKALPLEVALTEIRRCSGTQFDPKLAEAFLQIGVDSFRELISNHREQTKRLAELQQVIRAA